MARTVVTGNKLMHGATQVRDAVVVDALNLCQGGGGIGKALGGDEGGLI